MKADNEQKIITTENTEGTEIIESSLFYVFRALGGFVFTSWCRCSQREDSITNLFQNRLL
jgi:hypothetical protein